jgi:hypothetical protein
MEGLHGMQENNTTGFEDVPTPMFWLLRVEKQIFDFIEHLPAWSQNLLTVVVVSF